MKLSRVPKWTYFSILFSIIFFARGFFDDSTSLIAGIILGLFTPFLFIGVPALLITEKKKGLKYDKQRCNIQYEFKHHGLFDQIFYNIGIWIIVLLTLTIDLGAFITVPIINFRHIVGMMVLLFFSSLLGLVSYLLYVNDIRVYSIFCDEEFSKPFGYVEKKFGIIQMYKYQDIRDIEYKKNTLILRIFDESISYYIENTKVNRKFIHYLIKKANLPNLGLDEIISTKEERV